MNASKAGDTPPESPALQEPLLPHHPAFEKLANSNADGLHKLVALGMYVQAECLWAKGMGRRPTSAEIANFHKNAAMEHTLKELQERAKLELEKFSSDIVRSHQHKFLDRAIKNASEAVHRSKKAFWRGVGEAFVGALLWTLSLILFSVILQYVGIDLFEVYEKVGRHAATKH